MSPSNRVTEPGESIERCLMLQKSLLLWFGRREFQEGLRQAVIR
jgi:hypothetical protein